MKLPSQADKRRFSRFTDQHGRKWNGTIEIKTGLPVGALVADGFDPPMNVPPKYMKFDPREPNLFTIDYVRWIADLEEARRQWNAKLTSRARQLYGEQAGKHVRNPSPELLQMVGPEPPPIEPVKAAASGNRWMLGLTPFKPEWAKAFFPDTPTRDTTRRSTVRDVSVDMDEWADAFPDADEPEEATIEG